MQTKDELIDTLKRIVKPYVQDEQAFAHVTENTDFLNDLKINSANLVDIALDVEEEFNIVIDNEAWSACSRLAHPSTSLLRNWPRNYDRQ